MIKYYRKDNPVKVLLIADGGEGGIGGSEVFAIELLNRVDKNAFQLVLCCIDTGNLTDMLKEIAEENGHEFVAVKYMKKFRIDIKAILRLRGVIESRKIDVVHVTSGYTAIAGTLASLGLKVPIIFTFQNPVEFSRKTRLFFAFLSLRINLRIAVSKATAYSVDHGGFIFPLRKTNYVIYNGIDLQRFVPIHTDDAKRFLGLCGFLTVGSVGKLIPRKGYKYLLNAIPKIKKFFPNIKIVLTGDGEEEKNLKFLSQKLGLQEDVIFLGTRRDIPKIMSSFDVFVLPSLSEGIPFAILEALALKKPVVATDVGGVPEAVIEGRTGFLVPPEDSDSLAQAIISLLQDPELAKRLGEEGRQLVEERFNIKNIVKEYEILYRRTCKRQ